MNVLARIQQMREESPLQRAVRDKMLETIVPINQAIDGLEPDDQLLTLEYCLARLRGDKLRCHAVLNHYMDKAEAALAIERKKRAAKLVPSLILQRVSPCDGPREGNGASNPMVLRRQAD